MIKEKEFKKEIDKLLLDLDINLTSGGDVIVEEFIQRIYKKKPKKVKKDMLIGVITIDNDEDRGYFKEDPEVYISECELDMPSFSFDKGDTPDAGDGDMCYLWVDGELYSFEIYEGECVEASWSGSIYETVIKNVKLIPEREVKNYNLVQYI